MAATVRFTICAGEEPKKSDDGGTGLSDSSQGNAGSPMTLLAARLLLQVEDAEVDLGLRSLDVTLERLLEQSPLMMPEAAERLFSQWLWQDDAEGLRQYREAVEQPQHTPHEVAWSVCGPMELDFPDLPVEALLGDRSNPVAVYREVPGCTRPLSDTMSRFLPPLGVWTVAPVSLMPRSLLPAGRDPVVEYDAIVKRRLPTLEVLDIEYGPTRERLAQVLHRLGEAHVHVLHLIGDFDADSTSSLQFGGLTGTELAHMLSAGSWPELQLIVISGRAGSRASGSMGWSLMRHLPVPAVLSYQGQPRWDSCLLPFTERFYGALAAGYSVLQAATRARLSMYDSGRAETADVLAPTLFLRADTDPPTVRGGDPGLEGLLAAADAMATARDIFEDPAVLQLAENIPAALAQMHSRLMQICQRDLHQQRMARDHQNRLMRQTVRQEAPTYTAHAAVAEQLHRVLSMAPAPAHGTGGGSSPTAPPGLDWSFVLQRAHPSVSSELHAEGGPDRLFGACCDLQEVLIERAPGASEWRMSLYTEDAPQSAERAGWAGGSCDLTRWPPKLQIMGADSDDDRDFLAQLERDVAADTAQVVRNLLKYHFRHVLGSAGEPAFMPPGLSGAALLRGGLASLGIRVADVATADLHGLAWPRGAYLLEDLDERTYCLVILRPSANRDESGGDIWEQIAAHWEQTYGQHGGGCAVYVDVWPSVSAQFWQPSCAFAPSSTPSWVWDQLPRAITEYRGLLLDRLWEWWIGALVLEHDSV